MEISFISLLVKTVLEFFIEGQEAAYRPGDFNPNFITFFQAHTHKKNSPTCHPIQRGKRKLFMAPHLHFLRHLALTDPAVPHPCAPASLPHSELLQLGPLPARPAGPEPPSPHLCFHPISILLFLNFSLLLTHPLI